MGLLSSRITRGAWELYVEQGLVNSQAEILAKHNATKNHVEKNITLVQILHGINPSGLWQKTFLADMLLKLDTSFGALMCQARNDSTEWAQDAAQAIVHLFIELRRAKRNSKTSERAPAWLQLLFGTLNMDRDDTNVFQSPRDTFLQRRQTSGDANSVQTSTPLISTSSSRLFRRLSEASPVRTRIGMQQFYYDRVRECAVMINNGQALCKNIVLTSLHVASMRFQSNASVFMQFSETHQLLCCFAGGASILGLHLDRHRGVVVHLHARQLHLVVYNCRLG